MDTTDTEYVPCSKPGCPGVATRIWECDPKDKSFHLWVANTLPCTTCGTPLLW
ncbi:hypothetical protein AB0910_21160 [Streptomyces sp. NPDC047002]|uniref:hypothetical protein n=1 Tax=Streptomyces sp. NPDC047002 TaxID=3155475 RepID=UPI003455EB34